MPLRGPVPVKLHRKEDAEVLRIGAMTCFLLEDGSHTDNRIGAVVLLLPPGAEGPPMHWSRMHDECFFVTRAMQREQGGAAQPQACFVDDDDGADDDDDYDDDDVVEMLITSCTVRFTVPEGQIDAPQGSIMVVPPRAAHSFANPSETEEAEVYMTATPGYYIDYFKVLSQETEGGKELSVDESEYLMALFGTFPVDSET